MKYVVGYEREGRFVVLYECSNARVATLMAKKLASQRKEEIKIKKRG